MGVTRLGCGAAQHDSNNAVTVTFGRGHQVEARSARVTRLDAINAIDGVEQFIVVLVGLSGPGETRAGEIMVGLAVVVDHGLGQNGKVTGSCDLTVIGQAGCVHETCVLHAKAFAFDGHQLGKAAFGAAEAFGDDYSHIVC